MLFRSHAGLAGATVMTSRTNSIEALVDGSSDTRTVSVGAGDIFGGQNLLSGITLSATFIKCADLVGAPLPANCDAGLGPAYASEIILRLISPTGTEISLVEADRYFGPGANDPDPGKLITVLFDDTALSLVGDSGFESGSFLPLESLGFLLGETVLGDWTLYIEDNSAGAPLGLVSFTLNLAVPDRVVSGVAEPGTFALMALGLLGIARRRRSPAGR